MSFVLALSIAVGLSGYPSDSLRIIDSLRHELMLRDFELVAANAEVRRADEQSRDFAMMLQAFIRTPDAVKARPTMPLSPYLTVGSEGVSHRDASVYGGIGVEYTTGHFGIDVAARYQFNPPDSSGVRWKTVFIGGLKIYLY